MKNLKKVLALILALCMTAALAACTAPAPAADNTSAAADAEENAEGDTEATSDFKIALVIGVGGLGDGSFNDTLKLGCDMACEAYGLPTDYQLIEPKEVAEFEADFTDLAASGKYDLIVCGGFDAIEPVANVAKDFPEQKFLFVDGAVEGCDNVASFTYRDNEKAYMLGIIAANETKTNKLGVYLALDIPSLRVFSSGFIAGAQSVNPDIEISVKIGNGFADTTNGKEMAFALNEEGADIIYVAAGGSGLGCFAAAEEKGDFYCIGADVNQCLLSPAVIVSGRRLMQNTIKNGIGRAMEGDFVGGAQSEGLKEEALDYTTEGSAYEFKAESLDMANQAWQDIIDGKITVPSTYEEIGFEQ